MRYPTAALAALAIIPLALAAAGCGEQKTALPHAVYANAVPIYPGAVLEESMGSTTAGYGPESVSDGMAWFFDVQAPADRLIAYYQRKLPTARRDPVWQEGVRLVWVPEGAAPGEEVSIVIGENELSIREDVRPGKRPGNPNEMSQGLAGELSGAVPESPGGDEP